MRVDAGTDPAEFAAAALPWLERDPVRNNIPATVVAAAVAAAGTFHGAVVRGDDGRIEGAAVCVPPYPVALSTMAPDAAGALAAHMASDGVAVSGVSGPAEAAEAFAARWAASTGVGEGERTPLLLYRLGKVTPPYGVPGGARVAGPDDRDLLVGWSAAFLSEVHVGRGAQAGSLVDERLRGGRLLVWTDGGRDVAMAGSARPAAGVVRVGLVYTPPEARRHGYAGALVAEVSARAMAAGAKACMLFTESANVTSNRVYRRVGYQPVAESLQVMLG